MNLFALLSLVCLLLVRRRSGAAPAAPAPLTCVSDAGLVSVSGDFAPPLPNVPTARECLAYAEARAAEYRARGDLTMWRAMTVCAAANRRHIATAEMRECVTLPLCDSSDLVTL